MLRAMWQAVLVVLLLLASFSWPQLATPARIVSTVLPSQPASLVQNACAPGAALPTTPAPAVPPAATPVSFVGSVDQSELPPPAPTGALASLPLPGPAQPLAGALVSIGITPPYGYGSREARADGLLVSADGLVLSVLDYSQPMGSIAVELPNKGALPADISRVDPLTGATLLKVDASGLPFATLSAGPSAAYGQPALLLTRDASDGNVLVRQGFAGADDPDAALFSLLPVGNQGSTGSPLLNAEGAFLGMAGAWPWWGTAFQAHSAPPPGPARPAVRAGVLLALLSGAGDGASPPLPAGLSYHGQAVAGSVDSPVLREGVRQPAADALRSLGAQTSVAGLDGTAGDALGMKPGTALELVYAQPQDLRSAEGALLGQARYVAFWWGRAGGAPDVVLCGSEPGRFGAAFLAGGLAPLRAAIDSALVSPAAYSSPPRLPGYPGDYPIRVTVQPDKPSYVAGETVRLTVTVTNQSEWSAWAFDFPPAIEVRALESGPRWQKPAGDGARLLSPHETVSVETDWPQVGLNGAPVPPGVYDLAVYWRDARGNGHGRGAAPILIQAP